MESNNSNDDNYGEEEHQLRRSTRKRKFNEFANDGHGQPTAAEEEQKQQENLSKKNCGGQLGDIALEVCTEGLK
jgi:hypothetical protein